MTDRLTRGYLDHASTSPLRPAARDALVEAIDAGHVDPARLHAGGLRARVALETAREQVAEVLGARPREVVFTSGATESIAAVCWGASQRGGAQVFSAIEHSAVRLSATQHGPVSVVGCSGGGRVDPTALLGAAGDDTAAVHLQWVNHEVGTVQPVSEVIERCRDRGMLVHVDAAQAIGHLPFDFASLGSDFVSISGHKVGGPAGVGILLVRRGVRVPPLLLGGDQERARRAGLENIPAAIGLAAALTALDQPGESARQSVHADALRAAVTAVDGTVLHGDVDHRSPHIVCCGIADIEPQAILLGLDRRGVEAHSGSACASEGLEPSPVLEAMGVDAHHSLRLSTGWSTTDEDVRAFATAFPDVVAELRSLRR